MSTDIKITVLASLSTEVTGDLLGELRICGLNEVVKEVFDISGFDMILPISASESEALEGF